MLFCHLLRLRLLVILCVVCVCLLFRCFLKRRDCWCGFVDAVCIYWYFGSDTILDTMYLEELMMCLNDSIWKYHAFFIVPLFPRWITSQHHFPVRHRWVDEYKLHNPLPHEFGSSPWRREGCRNRTGISFRHLGSWWCFQLVYRPYAKTLPSKVVVLYWSCQLCSFDVGAFCQVGFIVSNWSFEQSVFLVRNGCWSQLLSHPGQVLCLGCKAQVGFLLACRTNVTCMGQADHLRNGHQKGADGTRRGSCQCQLNQVMSINLKVFQQKLKSFFGRKKHQWWNMLQHDEIVVLPCAFHACSPCARDRIRTASLLA